MMDLTPEQLDEYKKSIFTVTLTGLQLEMTLQALLESPAKLSFGIIPVFNNLALKWYEELKKRPVEPKEEEIEEVKEEEIEEVKEEEIEVTVADE